jgi:hypothetical protein
MLFDKINKSDYRFVPVDADPNFDPKHNEDVIEKTIKATDEMMAKRHREAVDKVRERTTALSMFIKGVQKGGSTSNLNKYFGNKEIARLRGNEVRDRLDQLRVLSKEGKIMRKVME